MGYEKGTKMTRADKLLLHQHALPWSLFLPYHKKIAAEVYTFHFQRGFLGVLTWQLKLVQGNEHLYGSSGAGLSVLQG